MAITLTRADTIPAPAAALTQAAKEDWAEAYHRTKRGKGVEVVTAAKG